MILILFMLELLKKYKDNIFTTTLVNGYKVINVNLNNVNNSNILELGKLKDVILKDNHLLARSPIQTCEFSYFITNNKNYTIEECIEGMTVNCFFHENKWNISTNDNVNDIDINYLFNSLFNSENWELMNKKYSYSFVIQDKSLNLITKNSKIYLIEIYNEKLDNVDINNNLKNIHIPKKFNESLENIIKDKCHINSDYRCKGIILKSNDCSTKIQNSAFEYYRYIFNNSSLIKIFNYFYLSKEEYIEKYDRILYSTIKKKFYELTYTIYIAYRNVYIRKNVKLDDFDSVIINVLRELHSDYINRLMHDNKYITKRYVIEKMNGYCSYKKFNMVSNIPQFYKLLNKMRI